MEISENTRLQAISESFGLIFLLERKLEYICDKVLAAEDLTAKQWLVLAAIEKLCKERPSIQEVAKELATSHQNIKAIALNLEKRGFVTLEKDHKDRRVTRLTATAKSTAFWQSREEEDRKFLLELFRHLSPEHTVILQESLRAVLKGTDELTGSMNKDQEMWEE